MTSHHNQLLPLRRENWPSYPIEAETGDGAKQTHSADDEERIAKTVQAKTLVII